MTTPTPTDIRQRFPGYAGWKDPELLANFAATGGVGKQGTTSIPVANPTATPTYSGPTVSAEQSRVDEITKALSSNIKNLPQTADAIRNSTLQNDAVSPALYGQYSDAIRQLYEHDKGLGERYSNPQGEMYIEDPVARERSIQASRGPMVGNLSNINNLITTRRQVMGDAAQRGLEIYKAGIAAQELELSTAEKALQRKLDADEKKSGQTTKTNENTADVWMKILATPGVDTEDDVWNLINMNDTAWRAAGVDVDKLWQWHKELVDKAMGSKYPKDFMGPVSPNSRVGIEIPGVKLTQNTAGQRQLTTEEIKAGVLTNDNDQSRNAKMAQYVQKTEDDAVIQFIDEAIKRRWSQQQIRDYIKGQGKDPARYEENLKKAKGYKGILPDNIPIIGGL